MGEDPGKAGTVTADELRRDIEQTREELGDTAAALGAKADVKGRAKERANEIRENPPVPVIAAAGAIAVVAVVALVVRRRRS
jgi:Protein of unknown function (DUF3618)